MPTLLTFTFRHSVSRDFPYILRLAKRGAYTEVSQEKSLLNSLFLNFGVGDATFPQNAIQVEYKMHLTPTIEEVKTIIKKYHDQSDSPETTDDWEDVGFQFKGRRSETVWLGGTVARHRFSLDVQRAKGGQLIETTSLLNAIVDQRKHLLRYAKKHTASGDDN